jgi:ribosomal protein S18 acetylase RimI-like enzyme
VPPSYSIRLATRDEVALLPQIERLAMKRLIPYLEILKLSPEKLENVVAMHVFLRSQAEKCLWVATIDEKLVGFIVARPIQGSVFIIELDVLPEFSRQGIGSALMQAACQDAQKRGFSLVTLTTFRHIPWTIPFYRKLGFEIVPYADLCSELKQIVNREEADGFFKENRATMQSQLH